MFKDNKTLQWIYEIRKKWENLSMQLFNHLQWNQQRMWLKIEIFCHLYLIYLQDISTLTCSISTKAYLLGQLIKL